MAPKSNPHTVLSVRVSDSLRRQLEERAVRNDRTVAAEVRRILREAVQQEAAA